MASLLLRIAYKIYRPVGILKERRQQRLVRNVLNAGERYDPEINPAADNNHLPRYRFALGRISAEQTVIDIACGTGYGTEMLARKCKYAVGADTSEQAISYCRRKRKGGNLQYVLSDFFAFHGRADAVVCFETVEHIRCESISQVFARLDELAVRTIIGSFPYLEEPGANKHHYFSMLSEKDLEYFSRYKTEIYYQSPDGVIHASRPEHATVQNLVFVVSK